MIRRIVFSVAGNALTAMVLVATNFACSGDDGTNNLLDVALEDIVADTIHDGTASEDVPADDNPAPDVSEAPDGLGSDVDVPSACGSQFPINGRWEVAPDLPPFQIHGDLAGDSTGFWFAMSNLDKEAGETNFRIFLGHIKCDGTWDVPFFPVVDETAGDMYDADIAINGDGLMVVWMDSRQTEDPATRIGLRVFNLDGTPKADARTLFPPGLTQLPVTMWKPKVSTGDGDGFMVAGVWASPNAERLQAFFERLNSVGQPLISEDGGEPEPIFDIDPMATINQDMTSVADGPDGTHYFAWLMASDDDEFWRTNLTTLEAGSTTVSPTVSTLVSPSTLPVLAGTPDGTRVFLAYTRTDNESVEVLEATNHNLGSIEAFDTAGKSEHSPGLAFDNNFGALTWYREREGVTSDTLVQGFTFTDGAISPIGYPVLLNQLETASTNEAISVYPPEVASMGGGYFLVTWTQRGKLQTSDGTTETTYRLHARAINLNP